MYSYLTMPLKIRSCIVPAMFFVQFFFISAFAGAVSAKDISLLSRVEQLEAESEIRNLLVDYAIYLDKGDFAAYSQLFAREGTWKGRTSKYVPIKGPKAIRMTMEKAFATNSYDPARIESVHIVTNIKIRVDGDRATGYSKWTVMKRNDNDEPFPHHGGHYLDEYIREDGQWKFLSRDVRRDIPE